MKINGVEYTRALIIDEPWIKQILQGTKTWEMRSTSTKIRGPIALVKKGTGTIVGTAELDHCGAAFHDIEQLQKFSRMHQIDYIHNPDLKKWNTPWVLKNVRRIEPINYQHKKGAVIWVKI